MDLGGEEAAGKHLRMAKTIKNITIRDRSLSIGKTRCKDKRRNIIPMPLIPNRVTVFPKEFHLLFRLRRLA